MGSGQLPGQQSRLGPGKVTPSPLGPGTSVSHRNWKPAWARGGVRGEVQLVAGALKAPIDFYRKKKGFQHSSRGPMPCSKGVVLPEDTGEPPIPTHPSLDT